MPVEDGAIDAVGLEGFQGTHRRPVGSVENDGQVIATRQIEESPEVSSPPRHTLRRVARALEAVPGQPDLAQGHQPRVVGHELRLHARQVLIGQVVPLGMKAHGRPHGLAGGGGRPERADIGLEVAADGDGAPDAVLGGPRERAAQVLVGGIVKVAVAVYEHRDDGSCQAPATTILPIRTVGAAVRSRKTRSFPTPSMARNISSRLPATVISSTG